jgi:hypothetical protein
MSDDERERERQAILQRRAKLVAYAVAAGVATAACSGKTSSVCLSLPAMDGIAGKPVTTGGSGVCLSISPAGTSGAAPTVGGYAICLEPPYPCLSGAPSSGPGGAGGEAAVDGGAGGAVGAEGGAVGDGGFGPSICLTPVP